MSWLAAGGYVAAAWLMVLGLAARRDRRIRERLGGAQPRFSLLVRLGRRARMPRARAEVGRRLAAAGRPSGEVDRVLGLKVVAAAAGGIMGLSGWARGPLAAALLGAVLTAAGFRLPDFLLARRVGSARGRASAGVADLLDLVAVSVTAGLTPRLALERAPEMVEGPLADELSRARREVSLGAPWRAALRSTAQRTGLSELRRLAVTLERSERLGSPVADRLRELAREVRAERRARREERARRAPVTMLFPLVFLILPAFVLAAVVPALLVATRGLP